MGAIGRTGRHRTPEETRARLIDAAIAEFAERGYAATSIKQICRRADVSVGSFYHQFDDKTVIVATVLGRAGERFADDLAAVDVACPQSLELAVAAVLEGTAAPTYRFLREAVEVEPRLAGAAASIRAIVHDRVTATVRAARAYADPEYALDAPSLAWTLLSLVRDALAGRGGPSARAIATVVSHSAAARMARGR